MQLLHQQVTQFQYVVMNMNMKKKAAVSSAQQVDIGKGKIKHNHLAALVTSKVFKSQVVKAKKGKGAYKRKDKHKGRESYLIAA